MLRKIIIALVTSAAVGLDALSARIGGWWHHLRRRRRQSLPKRNLNDCTMASNIAWDWAPNLYVAALIAVGLAIGANQIVTGIQYLAAVLRRNGRP